MPQDFFRNMHDIDTGNIISAQCLVNTNSNVLSSCQKECIQLLKHNVQLEQESYLKGHPEVIRILKTFLKQAVQAQKRHAMNANTAHYFTRPISIFEDELKELYNLSSGGAYLDENKSGYENEDVYYELYDIIKKHNPLKFEEAVSSETGSHVTPSSSFLSVATSSSTVPTPGPVKTPEPALSEVFYKMITDILYKATICNVTEKDLIYDTAYIELMKIVEKAMETPVIEIREDIAMMYNDAYNRFDLIIMEKERNAADVAWEKRMRNKWKRILRRQNNFKGYETPITQKSKISLPEGYKKAPPRLCPCQPQGIYNRYPKDRFGIYLPRNGQFSQYNINDTPANFIELKDEEIINQRSKNKKK